MYASALKLMVVYMVLILYHIHLMLLMLLVDLLVWIEVVFLACCIKI